MPNAVTRRQKRGKEKKTDMENSECVVECDWAGRRWRGTDKGAEGREGRRAEWRCDGEIDDKSPQQYLKTKLIMSNLPEKHKILSHGYGLTSTEAAPPSSLLHVKGQACCNLSACADEPWGTGRAGPQPSALLTSVPSSPGRSPALTTGTSWVEKDLDKLRSKLACLSLVPSVSQHTRLFWTLVSPAQLCLLIGMSYVC